MTPKISIIVPIYNVGEYLPRSIDSLINQTFKDIEIILVNDGSTDNSLNICLEYKAKDCRIKVIDKTNGGVSSARNAGIKVAKGEYVGFIDPDDWVEQNMYFSMYNRILNTHSDVCISNFIIEKPDISKPVILNLKKRDDLTNEMGLEIISRMVGGKTVSDNTEHIMGSVCRLLINRNIIQENNIEFNTDIYFMEDLIFSIYVLSKSKKICIDNSCHYHYTYNQNSAVRSYKPNMLKNNLKVYSLLKDILLEEDLYYKMIDRMETRYLKSFINAIVNETHVDNPVKFTTKYKNMKNLNNDTNFLMKLNKINTNDYKFKGKVLLFLLRNKMIILLYIYYRLSFI